jgi:sec-independent protein translocase protein TatC
VDQIGEHTEKEMSFIDHLEVLRWHVVRALAAVMIFAVVAFVSKGIVFDMLILGPAKPDFWTFKMLCKLGGLINSPSLCIEDIPFLIQSRTMTGQFTMHLMSSFAIGIIVAFPYIFWEMWRFIGPGLHSDERSVSKGAVFFVTVLFSIGVSFGYFIMSPLAVNFLANYQVSAMVMNEFDITSYVSTITTLVLGSGFLFQLPMVIYFLSKVGVVTPTLMKTYRKHAIVVILFLGAILTPPDPMSQVLIAFPLFGLYQFSILISASVWRKKNKAEQQQSNSEL